MSVEQRQEIELQVAEMTVPLDNPIDAAASSMRSRDGPISSIPVAAKQWRPPVNEDGEVAAPPEAPEHTERIVPITRTTPCDWRQGDVHDLWNPPMTRAQQMHQLVVAVIIAVVLVALLGQVGL
jgi:hypothetical protein